jgi:phage host-nuclease inhibitor protein Gam
MPPRTKIAAQTVSCESKDDLIACLARYGTLARKRARMKADTDDRIASLQQTLGHAVEPLDAELKEFERAIAAYCEANRAALTNDNKVKTCQLTTGIIGWRQRPPSVTVRTADLVIETLKKLGLEKFVRQKEEINKDAILESPDDARGIAGLSINTGVEDFYIQPTETKETAPA